jgi:hypothetical protein
VSEESAGVAMREPEDADLRDHDKSQNGAADEKAVSAET